MTDAVPTHPETAPPVTPSTQESVNTAVSAVVSSSVGDAGSAVVKLGSTVTTALADHLTSLDPGLKDVATSAATAVQKSIEKAVADAAPVVISEAHKGIDLAVEELVHLGVELQNYSIALWKSLDLGKKLDGVLAHLAPHTKVATVIPSPQGMTGAMKDSEPIPASIPVLSDKASSPANTKVDLTNLAATHSSFAGGPGPVEEAPNTPPTSDHETPSE